MRGRKPKPTAQRELEGNPGKRPLNDREPDFPPADAQVPIELVGNARAITEWQRLFPLLETARVVTEGDRAALLALCQQWSRYLEATEKVASAGMVVQAPSGYPMANPYLPIANKAFTHCMKLWTELGLTPSSRSRVTTMPPGHQTGKPQSTLEKLQQQAAAMRRPVEVK